MYFDAQSLANRRLCYCQQSLFEASSYTLVVRTCLRTEDRNVSNNIQRIRVDSSVTKIREATHYQKHTPGIMIHRLEYSRTASA